MSHANFIFESVVSNAARAIMISGVVRSSIRSTSTEFGQKFADEVRLEADTAAQQVTDAVIQVTDTLATIFDKSTTITVMMQEVNTLAIASRKLIILSVAFDTIVFSLDNHILLSSKQV